MKNICGNLCNGFMVVSRTEPNGIPFESQLDPLRPSSSISFKDNPFLKVIVVIVLTSIVFILLIAGTATTAISYPPEPPKWKHKQAESEDQEDVLISVHTALDGDYKLLGPLLLMAGIFLFVVDAVLCSIVIREAYYTSRSIRPSIDVSPGSISVLGGPFFLAVPNPGNQQEMTSFALSRQLWAMPNAPTPDFSIDGCGMKGSRMRPSTATIGHSHQPPFNPDIALPKSPEKS
ncbi:uncharacterized protein [Parasteatoda tepidariorum]|nr:uncharacterized protein LOC107455640 isoform X1 [Parasteatoda tepidariorum]